MTTTALAADPVCASRDAILHEIGDPADLTVVHAVGNLGDELITAGTAALLADLIYREITIDALPRAGGHTVLLPGGGAFCRPYHELMPRALAVAGLRFERVIVLPSSFDPSEDRIRDALSASRAVVFAREAESYRRIAALCDARLAHDCAFFFDYAPYRRPGRGTLNAFRTDAEAIPGRLVPADNEDISRTAAGLEQWLQMIAEHELVRTDRAHVMIAGALLGKRVEYLPSAYHKLDGIARFALAGHPVTRLTPPPSPPSPPPPRSPRSPRQSGAARGQRSWRETGRGTRVTAIILTRDRPARALDAIDSVRTSGQPARTLVLDNNSAPQAAAVLAHGVATRDAALRRSDRNLGCAGGRAFALEFTDSEFVLFLDDDAVLAPGALDALVADLDAHPETVAVSATVVLPDGSIQHSGGLLEVRDGVADFTGIGAGQDPRSLGPSGPAGWVPGTAALVRREIFERFPLDTRMSTYFEDNEWCYRVGRSLPGCFRRSREAEAVHRLTTAYRPGIDFDTRSDAVGLLAAHARFYERHGVLLGTALLELVPELRGPDGVCEIAAARLLMELLLARGEDWTFMEWMNGGLDAVLSSGGRLRTQAELITSQEQELAARERVLAEQAQLLTFLHQRHETLVRVEQGGWWRLRGRLLPVLSVVSRARTLLRGGQP